jgi:hypothetical protein
MAVLARSRSNLTYLPTELEQFSQGLVARQLPSSDDMSIKAERPCDVTEQRLRKIVIG